MKNIKNTLGLTLGLFSAIIHLVWSLLVALKAAEPLMDWVLSLHHIEFQYSIVPFSIGSTVWLVILTFVLGYIIGWALGTLWSILTKK